LISLRIARNKKKKQIERDEIIEENVNVKNYNMYNYGRATLLLNYRVFFEL